MTRSVNRNGYGNVIIKIKEIVVEFYDNQKMIPIDDTTTLIWNKKLVVC